MKKLNLKLAVVFMCVLVAVVGIALALIMNATNNLVSTMLSERSVIANNSFVNTLENYKEQAIERAEMIASSPDVVRAVIENDYDGLIKSLNNLSIGLDLITLCDAEGIVLARTHNDKKGDSVISQQAISTALSTGKGIKTIEPGTVIGLSTRGSAAIKDADGKIIGALTCGHDLSKPKYIDEIKAQNNCEATFFAGDERMNTTLIDENGNRTIGTKASDKVVETVINNKQDYKSRLELFGKMYEVYYSPVIINGQAIGMLFTGVHINDTLAQEQYMIVITVVASVMLVLAIIVTLLIINWTTKKIFWYESILDSIPFPLSITDMDMNWTFINKPVEGMLNIKRTDILGKHCSNWGAAICNTDNCGITCLHNNKNITMFEQAGMDFKVDVSYLLDSKGNKAGHIELVQDITKLIETQKSQTKLMEDVSKVSGTFAMGSRQIAEGSQTLADGSAQQAAAVEQLSASIAEISEKTRENAEMAEKASELALTIKENAEKGTGQMDQMIKAVNEINQASQSINKVIKVIDDIAFQTNILALNAAVEAARAGQHGKGFAVVAEEVRNLAAKSADAAKDTGGLIANSIQKAELGAKIAGETAASLALIVSGINESNQIVGEITKSSEEQALGISQINKGISQVAIVVQQNSATAQQSAAASSEMSEQSVMLEQLVEKFALEN